MVGLSIADEDERGWKVLGPMGVAILAIVANDLISSHRYLANLFTYAYDRPLPEDSYPRAILFTVAVGFGLVLLLGRWIDARRLQRYSLGALAGICALALAWCYQTELGHSLSQQDLFETYRALAKAPRGTLSVSDELARRSILLRRLDREVNQ